MLQLKLDISKEQSKIMTDMCESEKIAVVYHTSNFDMRFELMVIKFGICRD